MPTLNPGGRDAAVRALEIDVWDTLIRSATADPTLTVEDELTVLASVQHRLADGLRRGAGGTRAATAADGLAVAAAAEQVPEPHPHTVKALTDAFKQVLAHASRCPQCNRLPDEPCRCIKGDRPDPYPIAIAAIFPLIAALTAGGIR